MARSDSTSKAPLATAIKTLLHRTTCSDATSEEPLATTRAVRTPPLTLRGLDMGTIKYLLRVNVEVSLEFNHQCFEGGQFSSKRGLLWRNPFRLYEDQMPLMMTFYIEENIVNPPCCRDNSLFTFHRIAGPNSMLFEDRADDEEESQRLYNLSRRLYTEVLTHELWEQPQDKGLILPRLIRSYSAVLGGSSSRITCVGCRFGGSGSHVPTRKIMKCKRCRMKELLMLEVAHKNEVFISSVHPRYAVSSEVSLPCLRVFPSSETKGKEFFKKYRIYIRIPPQNNVKGVGRFRNYCQQCRTFKIKNRETAQHYSKCLKAIASLVLANCPSSEPSTIPSLHVLCENVIGQQQSWKHQAIIPKAVSTPERLETIVTCRLICESLDSESVNAQVD